MLRQPPWQLAFCAVVLFNWSCQTNNPIGNGITIPDRTCIDGDGDGFGVNCNTDLDCNDSDPTIHDGCYESDSCSIPRTGCPCQTEGEELTCRTTEPVVMPDGVSLCYMGRRTCQDGQWSPCGDMSAYEPSADDPGPEGGPEPILGHPVTCDDTCDAGCYHIYDCPSATDIAIVNPNTAAENLRYDLELEVDDGAGGFISYPPSVIIQDGETEGYFYRTFGTTCSDTTMATWWAVDFDLYFIDPANEQIDISVRLAPEQADLLPYTDNSEPWIPVVSCPTPATCVAPVDPTDRQIVAGGNLFDAIDTALGVAGTQYQWLQLRVHLSRTGVGIVSPRLYHTDVYFFCDEAS